MGSKSSAEGMVRKDPSTDDPRCGNGSSFVKGLDGDRARVACLAPRVSKETFGRDHRHLTKDFDFALTVGAYPNRHGMGFGRRAWALQLPGWG